MIKGFLLVIFLCIFLHQRIRTTFANTQRRTENLWDQIFASAMIILYASVLGVAIYDFIINPQILWILTIMGFALLLTAIKLRTLSREVLGGSWSLYAYDKPKRLIKIGPYQHIRHPYYVGSLLELFSFSLIFNSHHAGLLTLLIYMPLIYVRAFIEEGVLNEKFGIEFRRYANKTNRFFSLRQIKDLKSFRVGKQLASVWKSFTFKRLLELQYLDNTIRNYARPYFIAQVMSNLIKIGFVDQLKGGEVHLKSYCDKSGHDFEIMRIICDYLYLVGILKKRNLVYALSQKGEKMVSISRGVFSLIYAYAPIFENLERIIKKEIVYGEDIYRRGEYVGRGSAELASLLPFPVAAMLMRKNNCKTILDLGCGSGDFLLNFCQGNDFYGYGIDLSPDAINFAQKRARDLNILNKKVEFEIGDIFNLKNSSFAPRNVDMISSMFVLHEFIEHGKTEKIVQILEQIKKNFPKSLILICELCKEPLKQLKSRPSGVMEHHLFHALSKQEIATRTVWHKIFKSANLKIMAEYLFEPAEQAYFVLKNTLYDES